MKYENFSPSIVTVENKAPLRVDSWSHRLFWKPRPRPPLSTPFLRRSGDRSSSFVPSPSLPFRFSSVPPPDPQTVSPRLAPADMSTATTPSGGRELSQPPSDGISNLRFSSHSDLLLVSSWDRVSIRNSPAIPIPFRVWITLSYFSIGDWLDWFI